MPIFAAIAIGAVASVASSAIASSGQEDANQANREISRENTAVNVEEAARARDFNSAEALKQRQWAADLAATSHQRGIADLRAAGLNPILSATQGGAQTPSGATASGQAAMAAPANAMLNTKAAYANVPQSAMALANTAAGTGKMIAETDNIKADTELKRAEFFEDPNSVTAGNEPKTHRLGEVDARTKFLYRQADHEVDRAGLTRTSEDLVREEIKNAMEENRRIRATTRDTTANAVLRELDQAEARGRSRFHSENPDYSTYRNVLPDLGSIVNSASRLRGMGR